jgi:hypothetical protein
VIVTVLVLEPELVLRIDMELVSVLEILSDRGLARDLIPVIEEKRESEDAIGEGPFHIPNPRPNPFGYEEGVEDGGEVEREDEGLSRSPTKIVEPESVVM